MSVDPIRGGDFSVGDVLARAWNIFIGNIVFFVSVTLLIYLIIGVGIGVIAGLAFLLGVSGGMDLLIGIGIAAAVIVVILLFIVLNTVGEAVLLLGAFQRLRGEPLRVNEALKRAFARFFPLFGLGILSGLAVMVGFVLVIVPGVILLVMWAVAVPACVVEGLGPIESMSRSSALTKGHRWKVFGLLLVLWFINGIGSQFFTTLLGAVSETLASVGSYIWLAVWTALWNCVLIMTYHDLRVAKEGIDTGQVAAIFD